MLTRTGKIICDECGHFIGFNALYDGKATHKYICEADIGEWYESYCARCVTKFGERADA